MTSTTSAEPFQRALLGVSALLFAASATLTIVWGASMSAMAEMPMPGGWTMSMVWMPMPGDTWAGAGARFVAMWLVMMVAMMLPPLLPVLSGFGRSRLAALAGAGYLAVWALFGAIVYALGSAGARVELAWPALARPVPLAAAAVLLVAGAVQLSLWKGRQLAACRNCRAPETGAAATVLLFGGRLGVNCSLCCLGLMGALLVGGMMNVAVVAGVAAAIALERLGPRPELLARAIGVAVLATGAVALARAL